jgi:UDP-N-acetylmuramoyl-tripeptide--D-alanyl-D-alanine ligase
MKKLARNIVVNILSWQLRRLRKNNSFKVVGVVGSIGKTSTKFAIAQVLKQHVRVRYQKGNYNDIVTVPLVFFGLPCPSLFNPLAWLATFIKIELMLQRPYPYDVVVAELGTDGPGQIARFGHFLRCDIAVVTAISLEHMEFFRDLDEVAAEELSVAKYSDKLVISSDLVSSAYTDNIDLPTSTYGIKNKADYQITNIKFSTNQASFELTKNQTAWLNANLDAVSKSEVYSASAAAVVADILGTPSDVIVRGIERIEPVSGRMQRLKGINNILILDETYNSSPEAAKAALDSLYMLNAAHKIAILGNMNELGDYSQAAHTELGKYCDPKQLDLVVTIGPDANKYLATAAQKAGCNVEQFNTPYQAGEFIKTHVKPGTIILAKGSQNKVFAEEAIKLLLADPKDAAKLVRQSSYWLAAKQKCFNTHE